MLDPHGLVREVNLAGAALLGLERERVTGRPFEQFVVPNSLAAFREFCGNVRPGEVRRSCETRLLKHLQGQCDVLVEGTVAEGGSVQDHDCRLAVTDITERKQFEEALRQTQRRNDGCGFEPEAANVGKTKGRGIGFTNMRERAAFLGGTCRVESVPKKGTVITVRVPYRGGQ